MIKVGIIGCGGIGRLHANAYSKVPNAELVALIDFDLDRAEKLAAEFGGKAYRSIDDCPEKLDLVSVVTPPSTHYKIVMDLLDRKIPVFCEKPITMDIDQAKEIVRKSEETGVPVGIGFKMRYEPCFEKAREMIGEVGKIFAVSAVKNQPYTEDPNRQWIKNTGCMYELSVHDYDLIDYIMDAKPISVRAKLGYDLGWTREDQAYLDVEYDNGVIGQLMSSYSTNTAWTGYDIALTFVGEKGYMRVERPDRLVFNTDKGYWTVPVEPIGGMDIFVVQAQKVVDALEAGREYHPNAADGALQTILIESANASHRENKTITLN